VRIAALEDRCRSFPGGIDNLASVSGASATSIYRAISGETVRPPVETLRRLAPGLETTLEVLVEIWRRGESRRQKDSSGERELSLEARIELLERTVSALLSRG
jgi:transcriptional regulator with XRE-family HTH domain